MDLHASHTLSPSFLMSKNKKTSNISFFFNLLREQWTSTAVMPPKRGGDGGSGAQKRAPAPLPDAVGSEKKSSTPSTSHRSTHKKTTNAGEKPSANSTSAAPSSTAKPAAASARPWKTQRINPTEGDFARKMAAAGVIAGPAAAAAPVVSNDWQTMPFSTVASSGSFGGGAASASLFGAAVNPASCFGKATGTGVASLGAGGFGALPSLTSLGAGAASPFGAADELTTLAPGVPGLGFGSDSDDEEHIGNCDDCRGYFDAGKDNCKTCGFDLNSYNEIDDDDDEHQRHGEG